MRSADDLRRVRLVGIGLTVGLLGGLLGVGGGIIIVPGLIWAAGVSRHTATGTSLVAILPVAVVATLTYALAPGGAFDPVASLVVIAGSVVGGVLGARMNARFSERGLRLTLAIISGLLGLRLIVPWGLGDGTDTLTLHLWVVAVLALLGLLGGFNSGLLGVSGSATVIALMVMTLGTSQVLAQGIALAAVVPTVLSAAGTHRRQGTLSLRLGLIIGAAGTLSAIPGALLAFAVPTRTLTTLFGAFLVAGSLRSLHAVLRRSPQPAPAEA
jgi:uncharacterized protein